MNRERTKQLLPLITAFAEGKEIQFRHSANGMWHPSVEPGWNANAEYRIKPEPVVVEKWAAVNHDDGRCYTFNSEQGARDFARVESRRPWSVFIMRGTYER